MADIITSLYLMNSDYFFRNLTIQDIPEAMKLVLAEGWNQTEKDWRLFIENPDNDCKCLTLEGELVGTAASYRYSSNLAWISMVLVNKSFRGRGLGQALLKSVLNELKDCKSIKLDATPAGQKVYEKIGFIKEYSISRMVCSSFNSEIQPNPDVIEIRKQDLPTVIDFDQTAFGVGRPKLIGALVNDFSDLNGILKRDGKILGIVAGRKGNRYYQIGPVSAISASTAIELISSVLIGLRHLPVVIDVLDSKTDLVKWLSSLGFQKKRQFCRMYFNDNSYPGEMDKQYVICGPEFG